MTIKQAHTIAAAHKCMIGRRKAGVYYVTWSDGQSVHETLVRGSSVKAAAEWIESNNPRSV